jgi:hypothetical protein
MLLFITSLQTSLSAQSPWTLNKNGFYHQLSFNTIPEYNTLFNRDEESLNISRNVVDNTLQYYTETGITDQITFLVSIPWKFLKSGELNPNFTGNPDMIPPSSQISTLGNIQTGIKQKISGGKWVSAAQLKIEFPAWNKGNENKGLIAGYDAFAFAPLLSAGRGWNKLYAFYYLSGIVRTNGYSEYLNMGAEGGWQVFKGFWLITYLDFLHSFKNGSKEQPIPEREFGLYSNNLEYFAFGFKAIYEFDLKEDFKLGFLGHAAGSFSGYAVAHSPLLTLGVFLKK